MEQNLSNGGADKPVPLDYASPDSRRRGTRTRALFLAAILILIIAMLPLLLDPGMDKGRRPIADRAKCAANLKSIALAMMLYANDHGGVFPDSFQTMILTEDMTAEVLVCPACDDKKAPGATPQEVAENLTAKPGHLSYIYLGRGLTSRVSADTVFAYELPANHANAGMNVLFGDWHVDFLAGDTALRFLAELHSGHNPPRAEMLK